MEPREGEWQYKRVYGLFRTRRAVEAAIEEQEAWGWRLIEVVGDAQLRFGRPYQVALKDVGREGNPYATRTACGSRNVAVFAFLMVFFSVCGLIMAVGALRERRVSPQPAVATRALEPIDLPIPRPEPVGTTHH